MSSAVPPYYTAGKLHLWVEDEITRAWLSAVWHRTQVHYLVTGGSTGMVAMATHAQQHFGELKVFGLIDRDENVDNEDQWAALPGVIYRPPAVEIENFLLDEQCMAAATSNTRGLDARAILQLMKDEAQRLQWWMTFKRVAARLRQVTNEDFPGDGDGKEAKSLVALTAKIVESKWFKTTLPALRRYTKADIEGMVEATHGDVSGWLEGDDWRREFSGKEIFEHIYGRARRAGDRSSIEDFAREIGNEQVRANRVPPSFIALEASLRRRADLPAL